MVSCSLLERSLRRFFKCHSHLLSSYPYAFLCSSFLLLLVLASGCKLQRSESNLQNLWLSPSPSQSAENFFNQHFPETIATVIVTKNEGKNFVLRNAVIEDVANKLPSPDGICTIKSILNFSNPGEEVSTSLLAISPEDYKPFLGGVDTEALGAVPALKFFFTRLPGISSPQVREWESKIFWTQLKKNAASEKELRFYGTSYSSLQNETATVTLSDAWVFVLVLLFMVPYVSLTVGKSLTILKSRLMAGIVLAVVSVLISVAAFGVAGYARIPFNPLCLFAFFLLTGNLVDNVFVVTEALFRLSNSLEKRPDVDLFVELYLEVGPAITLANVCEISCYLFAFIVLKVPGVSALCFIAFVGTSLSFLLQLTFFPALFHLHLKYVESQKSGVSVEARDVQPVEFGHCEEGKAVILTPASKRPVPVVDALISTPARLSRLARGKAGDSPLSSLQIMPGSMLLVSAVPPQSQQHQRQISFPPDQRLPSVREHGRRQSAPEEMFVTPHKTQTIPSAVPEDEEVSIKQNRFKYYVGAGGQTLETHRFQYNPEVDGELDHSMIPPDARSQRSNNHTMESVEFHQTYPDAGTLTLRQAPVWTAGTAEHVAQPSDPATVNAGDIGAPQTIVWKTDAANQGMNSQNAPEPSLQGNSSVHMNAGAVGQPQTIIWTAEMRPQSVPEQALQRPTEQNEVEIDRKIDEISFKFARKASNAGRKKTSIDAQALAKAHELRIASGTMGRGAHQNPLPPPPPPPTPPRAPSPPGPQDPAAHYKYPQTVSVFREGISARYQASATDLQPTLQTLPPPGKPLHISYASPNLTPVLENPARSGQENAAARAAERNEAEANETPVRVNISEDASQKKKSCRSCMTRRMERYYAPFITKPLPQLSVLVLLCSLLAVSTYCAKRIRFGSELTDLIINKRSYLYDFNGTNARYFGFYATPVQVLVPGPTEYTNLASLQTYFDIQKQFNDLDVVIPSNSSWATEFYKYMQGNTTATSADLRKFLTGRYGGDVEMEGSVIVASRFNVIVRFDNSATFTTRLELLDRLRGAAKRVQSNVSIYEARFLEWDRDRDLFYVSVDRSFLKSGLANFVFSLLILWVLFSFFMHPALAFFLGILVTLLNFSILAIMAATNDKLNVMNYCFILMTTGFVSNNFVFIAKGLSRESSPFRPFPSMRERIFNTLVDNGPALLHRGGWMGLVCLALAPNSHRVIRSFFKIFLGLNALGLFYGLVLLPGLLGVLWSLWHCANCNCVPWNDPQPSAQGPIDKPVKSYSPLGGGERHEAKSTELTTPTVALANRPDFRHD